MGQLWALCMMTGKTKTQWEKIWSFMAKTNWETASPVMSHGDMPNFWLSAGVPYLFSQWDPIIEFSNFYASIKK